MELAIIVQIEGVRERLNGDGERSVKDQKWPKRADDTDVICIVHGEFDSEGRSRGKCFLLVAPIRRCLVATP